MTAAELYRFGRELRSSAGVKPETPCSLNLKFGKKIDQDYRTSNEMEWDESGLMGRTREYKWDVSLSRMPWSEIPGDWSAGKKNVYRAYFSLGDLTREASAALTRWSIDNPASGIAPDCVGIEINPVCPATLSSEELACTGMISVNFSGNGYFTWGPGWRDYAAQYTRAFPVVEALRIARSLFPAASSSAFKNISDYLGERFLNRECYEEGDWILTVQESG